MENNLVVSLLVICKVGSSENVLKLVGHQEDSRTMPRECLNQILDTIESIDVWLLLEVSLDDHCESATSQP